MGNYINIMGFDLIEKRADGSTIIYISFWRYLIFGLLFAFAFYVLLSGTIRLYQELPSGFWRKWGKQATMTLAFLIGSILLPFFTWWFLKSSYKKVQLEIGKSELRYLKNGTRGGILLSETYETIKYSGILEINLRQQLIIGNVIEIQTTTRKHQIALLLSSAEQLNCYRALQDAIKGYRYKDQ